MRNRLFNWTCAVGLAIFIAQPAIADNPFADRLAQLPSYSQIMKLNKQERLDYQKGLRMIMMRLSVISQNLNMGLVAETGDTETTFRQKYSGVIDLFEGWLMPESIAAGLYEADPGCRIISKWRPPGSNHTLWAPSEECTGPDGKTYYKDQKWFKDNDEKWPEDPNVQAQETDCKKLNRSQEQRNFIRSKDKTLDRCIFAGNLSDYGGSRHRGNCRSPGNSYCLDPAAGPTQHGSKPLCNNEIKCENSDEIVCNPLVFGVAKFDQNAHTASALCVPHVKDATVQCGLKADAIDNRFDILNEMKGPWFDRWNDFAEKFNMVCGNVTSQKAQCDECNTILRGLHALNSKFKNKLFTGNEINKLEDRDKGIEGGTGATIR